MVGLQYTAASLAKCYEGNMRKINYPLIKDFDAKKIKNYSSQQIAYNQAAEEQADYINKIIDDDDSLPF
jgi:CRISPR-associated protein Cas1